MDPELLYFMSEFLNNKKNTVRQVAKKGEKDIIGNIANYDPPALIALLYSIWAPHNLSNTRLLI